MTTACGFATGQALSLILCVVIATPQDTSGFCIAVGIGVSPVKDYDASESLYPLH